MRRRLGRFLDDWLRSARRHDVASLSGLKQLAAGFDFPGADAGKMCGKDVCGPFVSEHDCLRWGEAATTHDFREFG